MTDAFTRKPMRVRNEGTAGPYIILPVSQLDEVRRLLESQHIRYWVGENAISINGGPETVIINLGREGNAAAVQALLDGVR
jgi:hypothetical protein